MMRLCTRAAPRVRSAQLFPRSFWSSTGRQAAATAEEASVGETEEDPIAAYHARHYAEYDDNPNIPQHGTKLYQWGAYSWYALLGTALVSKELYIVDSSVITHWIPDIVVFTTVAYLAAPFISNGLNSEVMLAKKRDIEAFELNQTLLDIKIKDITALEAQPVALETFVAEYKEALEAKAAAEIRLTQHQVTAETLAKLESAASKKSAADKASGDVEFDVILNYMLQTMSTDAKASSQSVDEAIAYLETAGSTDTRGDGFNSILNAYLESDAFVADKAAAEAAQARTE